MGASQSAATPVPAFMLCDGHYQIADDKLPAPWFEWMRLEGHGTVVLKKSNDHATGVTGEWSVLDERTVRLKLREPPDGNEMLLMREGDDMGRVMVTPEAGGQWNARFAFVAEEHDH